METKLAKKLTWRLETVGWRIEPTVPRLYGKAFASKKAAEKKFKFLQSIASDTSLGLGAGTILTPRYFEV